MNTSNFARLKELLRRAAAGQELTIAFLGGSITQGSLSTQPGNAYAFRVYQWFVDTFPQSKFHYVNGGIGGTSSHYGVARAVTDVLMYQPDFVAVDFSVNDLKVPFRQETYEGVVRKLLTWPSHPAADHPGALPQAGGFPGRPGGKAGASGPLEKRLGRSEARG